MASEFKLSGLASGADTQAMIDAMMAAKRAPITRLEETREKLGFEKEGFRSVNLYLTTLRTSLDALKLESTFLKKSVTSGNENVVTATASTTAQPGDLILSNITLATATRVSSLAVLNDNPDTAAVKQSSSAVVTGAGYNGSGVLDTSQTFANAGFDGQIHNGTITINGVKFTINKDTTTIDEFMGEVNNSAAGVSILYSAIDDKFTLTSTDTGSAASIAISDFNTDFFTEANIAITSTTYGSGSINPDKTLAENTFSPDSLTTDAFEISFKINDVPFSFNILNDTLNDVITTVNSSDAGVTMSYNAEADKLTLTNNSTGDSTVKLEDVYGNFLDATNVLDVTRGNISTNVQVGNATISATLRSNTAVNETYNMVFGAGGLTYDIVRDSDSVTIASNLTYTSGAPNSLNIDGVTFTITDGVSAPAQNDVYQVTIASNPNPTPDATAYHAGTDAQFDWNGVTMTEASNTFTKDGITVNLKEDYSSGNILLKVTNDTSDASAAISDFVEKYNNLVTLISPKILTDKQKTYLKPLTEDDRVSMTFAEVDEYENNYKLYNITEAIRKESSLNRLRTSLRSTVFSSVDGLSTQFDRLSSIGISTGAVGISVEQAKKGMLEIDTDTLNAALESDPQAVLNLFANDKDLTSSSSDKDGIARQLIDKINSAVSYRGFIERKVVAGGSIDKRLADVNSEIEKFEDRMTQIEERLVLEFANMETVLSNLNSQSQWLAGQLSGLPKVSGKK